MTKAIKAQGLKQTGINNNDVRDKTDKVKVSHEGGVRAEKKGKVKSTMKKNTYSKKIKIQRPFQHRPQRQLSHTLTDVQ